MDNKNMQAEIEAAIDYISDAASSMMVAPGGNSSCATILLNDENVNGDNCVVIVGQRADNTAYVSFYTDYYDPDNCTEHFECKDLKHAMRLLASSLVSD